jgi:hypothetical protein
MFDMKIRARMVTKLPASFQATGGLEVSKENGRWTLKPKWEDLAEIGSADIENTEVWTRHKVTGVYNRASLPLVIDGVVRFDSEQSLTDEQKERARENIGAQRASWVNVLDYGATGDGSTDDAMSFDGAAADGMPVFIPKPSSSYNFATEVAQKQVAWLPDPGATWAQIFDGGRFNMRRGKTTAGSNGCNIWRFADRVFVGGAASQFAGDGSGGDAGNSWFSDKDKYPAYLGINATLLVIGDDNPYGVVAAVKSSIPNAAGGGQHVIGVGSAIENDAAGKLAWGFIAEITRRAGASSTYGLEIAAKNDGNNAVMTPNVTPAGVYGLWCAGGGDDAFGGPGANNPTAAVVILANDKPWNSGIMFRKDALANGEAIAMSSEGDGGAHTMRWYNAAGNIVFNFRSSATDAVQWTLDRNNSGLRVSVSNKDLFLIATPGSAVNGLKALASAAGNAVELQATGDDTNVPLRLTPKGSGKVLTAAPVLFDGALLTGASATPGLLIQPAGATAPTWSTNGVGFAVNAGSGFIGNLIDAYVNATRMFTVTAAGAVNIATTGEFIFGARSRLSSPADGVVLLRNSAGSDFSRISFGGTTASFPAMKRNGTALETRLADDSGYAQHNASVIAVADGVTAPSATSGLAKIYVDSADGALKVIFGDGTVKTIVVDT